MNIVMPVCPCCKNNTNTQIRQLRAYTRIPYKHSGFSQMVDFDFVCLQCGSIFIDPAHQSTKWGDYLKKELEPDIDEIPEHTIESTLDLGYPGSPGWPKSD